MKKLRWGILGAADIARKNWQAVRNSGNSSVVAVASREVEKASRFIAECQRDAPMGTNVTAVRGYDALIADPGVDAVYIPLPTGVRKEWVIRAADAGKHVLCEKPCAMSAEDLREMIDACARNKVQFMDGVMFMHSLRLPKLREVLDKEIGQIKRITSAFSFLGSEDFFASNIRTRKSLEPFGCLGDLGWYCIRFALWVMNGKLPERVTGRVLAGAGSGTDGVPIEFSGELFFPDAASAGFYCSFLTETEQCAQISGSKGLIRLNDFVLPFFGSEVRFEVSNPVFRVSGCDYNMEPRRRQIAVDEYSNSHATSQETNMFRNFAGRVLSGEIDAYWPEVALKTQQVMGACLASSRNGGAEVSIA